MAKLVRINFTRGMYGSAEPRVAGDGYAAVLHNVDLRSGIAKPMKAPVAASDIPSVPSGTKGVFEFLGQWHYTPEVRDWAAERVGVDANGVRLYYCIPGQSSVKPQKIVGDPSGVQADIGTQAPTAAPQVETYESSAAGSIPLVATLITVSDSSLAKGSYEFKVLNKDARGNIVGRGASDTVGVPEGTGNILLEWTNLPNSAKCELYVKGPDDKQFFLFEVNQPSPHTVDTNPDEDFTKPWPTEDEEVTPVRYIYTNVRAVNGYSDESGPSDPSLSIEMGHGRKVTVEAAGTGSFDPDAGHTYANPIASALAGGTTLTIGTLASSAGKTYLTTTIDHGLGSGQWVVITEDPADGSNNGAFTVTVPTDPTPYMASSIQPSFSDDANGLPPGSYKMRLTKVVGLAYDDWTSGLVGVNRGAWSASSGDISFTISSTAKKVTFVLPQGSDCDMAVIHLQKDGGSWYGAFLPTDGSPHGGGATGYRDGTVVLNCSGATWPSGFGNLGTPQSTSKVAARAFSLNITMKNPRYRVAMPTCTKGTGVQINVGTALSGYTNGQKRTVDLSGFTLNSQLNKKFRATITDAATGKFSVNSWFNPSGGSTETGSQAVFSTTTGGSGTDSAALIDHRNLYRIGDSTEFLKVAELDPDEEEYIDTVKTADLGAPPDSYYTENGIEVIFAPPPANLEKIVITQGMGVGIADNTVRWTPVNRMDAWPATFMQPFPSKPRRLWASGGSVICLCSDSVWRGEFGSPTQAYWQKTPSEQGCVAPYSVQGTPWGVVYLSPIGLMMFDVGRNVSYPIFPNRFGRRFFLSPSIANVAFGHWWYPGNKSFAYTYQTREYAGMSVSGATRTGMQAQLDNLPTFQDPWASVRSFYCNGKYYLYYAFDSNYPNHTMLQVDLETQPPTLSVIGLRVLNAWVTETGNPYLMLPATQGTLAAAQALDGYDPDTDTSPAGTIGPRGGSDDTNVAMYRFLDELGTPGSVFIRTGPMNASINERVSWEGVSFHGTGTGNLSAWVDGWKCVDKAQFVATEVPTQARTINFPLASDGYSLDLEISGNVSLLAAEIEFEQEPSEG